VGVSISVPSTCPQNPSHDAGHYGHPTSLEVAQLMTSPAEAMGTTPITAASASSTSLKVARICFQTHTTPDTLSQEELLESERPAASNIPLHAVSPTVSYISAMVQDIVPKQPMAPLTEMTQVDADPLISLTTIPPLLISQKLFCIKRSRLASSASHLTPLNGHLSTSDKTKFMVSAPPQPTAKYIGTPFNKLQQTRALGPGSQHLFYCTFLHSQISWCLHQP